METPSSARRITRSQTSSLQNTASRSRNHRADRLALLDITNDSPISGVTLGTNESKTPASSIGKMSLRSVPRNTPCSGENLLRCQVKTLLQRVEEESEFPKLENQYLFMQKLCLVGKGVISPTGLLAPTPANTPEIFVNVPLISKPVEDASTFELPRPFGDLNVVIVNQAESPVTRALTFDSPEKSEYGNSVSSVPSSVLSYQEKAINDEDCSECSVNVHVSSPRPKSIDEVEGDNEFKEEDDDHGYEQNGEIDDDLCEELCRELCKMNMISNSSSVPIFEGTHIRFIYNSDDEIEEEEVVVKRSSPNVLHLKGLPKPKGKHVRFPEDERIAEIFFV